MNIIEIIFIAVGLAMDAFAVSLSAGSLPVIQNKRAVFRLAFHFGLFQFMMPVIGWFIGEAVVKWIENYDHWIAFIILAYIGINMIKEAFAAEEDRKISDPSKGMNMVMLAVATSIDALAVGFSLAMLKINIFYPSFIIGIITASLSVIAIKLGKRLGTRFGKKMEIAGGVILIIIGTRILLTHLII